MILIYPTKNRALLNRRSSILVCGTKVEKLRWRCYYLHDLISHRIFISHEKFIRLIKMRSCWLRLHRISMVIITNRGSWKYEDVSSFFYVLNRLLHLFFRIGDRLEVGIWEPTMDVSGGFDDTEEKTLRQWRRKRPYFYTHQRYYIPLIGATMTFTCAVIFIVSIAVWLGRYFGQYSFLQLVLVRKIGWAP